VTTLGSVPGRTLGFASIGDQGHPGIMPTVRGHPSIGNGVRWHPLVRPAGRGPFRPGWC